MSFSFFTFLPYHYIRTKGKNLYTAVMSVENHCKLSKVTVFCLQSYSFDLNVITCWGAGVELQTDFLCRSYLSQDLCHSQLE